MRPSARGQGGLAFGCGRLLPLALEPALLLDRTLAGVLPECLPLPKETGTPVRMKRQDCKQLATSTTRAATLLRSQRKRASRSGSHLEPAPRSRSSNVLSA